MYIRNISGGNTPDPRIREGQEGEGKWDGEGKREGEEGGYRAKKGKEFDTPQFWRQIYASGNFRAAKFQRACYDLGMFSKCNSKRVCISLLLSIHWLF